MVVARALRDPGIAPAKTVVMLLPPALACLISLNKQCLVALPDAGLSRIIVKHDVLL